MQIRLHTPQSKIWKSQARFKLLRCGRRFGKSFLEIIWLLHIAGNKKDAICWYVAPTYRQAESIAWVILKQIAKTIQGTVFNEQKLTALLPNGSRVILKGADNPDSLRGTYVDALVVDEIDFMLDWAGAWLVLRPLLIDMVAPAMFSSTPNGYRNLYNLEERARGNSDWEVFHFTSHDNPHLDTKELEGLIAEMTEGEIRQEIMAIYERPKGTVYSEWVSDNYKSVPYDMNLPLHVAFDWGVNDPTAIGWFQPLGSELRMIDYYEAPASVEQIVQVLASKPYKAPDFYVGDEAGNATAQTTGTSVITELAKRSIFVYPVNNKNIPDLIRQTKRNLKSFYINSEAPSTERFKYVMMNYRYPVKRDNAMDQSNEIPIHDEWSHGARMFEYYIRYLSSGGVGNAEPIILPEYEPVFGRSGY